MNTDRTAILLRYFLLFITIQLNVFYSQAQKEKYTKYSVNEGLPSSNVYRCIKDNKGYLWVATDAGIARFDGKHFQVFTTDQGLPDNEVLAVVKEKNGRIWVNCFKQKPAYFDEIKNRFINSKEDSLLAKIKEGTSIMYFFPLKEGGILFLNEIGSTILKDNKLYIYPPGERNDDFLINDYKNGIQLKQGFGIFQPTKKTREFYLYKVQGEQYLDSIFLMKADLLQFARGYSGGKFYIFLIDEGKCFIYSELRIDPLHFRIDSVTIPEKYSNFEFTESSFYLMGSSGKIYLFNKESLKLENTIDGDFLANSVFNDTKGNLWVSTIDKGVLLYKKKRVSELLMPINFLNKNFMSITQKTNGSILAGNFQSQVIEVNNGLFKINNIPKLNKVSRQRKIIVSQNKVFTFSESGIFVDFKRPIKSSKSGRFNYGKTAIAYNDSIIIVGQSSTITKLNTINESTKRLNGLQKRITALAKSTTGEIYYGSTDGLYKYDYLKDTARSLSYINPVLSDRITSIITTPDSLVWIATSGNGVVILKNDLLIGQITMKDGLVNNATRSICAAQTKQVWVGTFNGISIINYNLLRNKIEYTFQNLSVIDGLSSNVINEMLFRKDTIFAATSNGISVIPTNISIPKFNIPVEIQSISINQRDTLIGSKYILNYYQNNIQISFAGIELSGHFKNLEYSLDESKKWTFMPENSLLLNLSSGSHHLKVRAIDVNGNISNQVLMIDFIVKTPFWKAYWFWFLVAMCLQLFTIYYVSRWQKKKKEKKLAREIANVQTASLEQQAFTSLMNPHFIFNALNSIQYYLNVQDRQNVNRYLSDFASLIRKSFEAAQQYFIPLEQELEIVKIYLRLEEMRFSGRFSYRIAMDNKLDPEQWMIPTMLLQPLLENAILHGIMPSTINGDILLELSLFQTNLCIVITDNGIGIEQSRVLKKAQSHKSHGMELIRKRIAALNHFGDSPIKMEMNTAFADEKNPGNRITIIIPAKMHSAWLKAQKN
jgi:hypothetical protein